jgi:hypothetical protein
MPNYLFAYHVGRQLDSAEEGAGQMAKWEAWVGSLRDVMVNPGTPMGRPRTVISSGVSEDGGPNPLIGYSIIEAESMDAALELAKGCLYLEIGNIGVAEVMEMWSPALRPRQWYRNTVHSRGEAEHCHN